MRYNGSVARKFEERIAGYLLINHPPEKYAFTNLRVAYWGNIEVLAREHAKNLRNDGANRRVEESKVFFLEKSVGGLLITG